MKQKITQNKLVYSSNTTIQNIYSPKKEKIKMNKYQEAIEVIKSNYPPEHYSMLRAALDLSIELLEKAIAKKPALLTLPGFSAENASHLSCPNYKQPIVNVWNVNKYNPHYCHYCGQRLDWSKEE